MKPFIIGLSGKKGSGKDHTARLFTRSGWDSRQRVVRFAFADELKRELADSFGVNVEFIEQHKEKFRLLLQAWGVARRDIFGEYYWIDILDRKLAAQDCDVAVITDVRFLNEAEYIRGLGGILVRINRETQSEDTHVSETDLDGFDFDYTLFNGGSNYYSEEVGLLWNSVVVPRLNAFSAIK